MVNAFNPAPQVTGTTGVDGTNKDKIVQVGALQVGSEVLTEAQLDQLTSAASLVDQSVADIIGAGAVADGLAVSVERTGSFFKVICTLTAMRVAITDSGAGGSFGSQELFAFADAPLFVHMSAQDYTVVTESVAVAFTGDTTDTLFTITNVSDTAGLFVGQPVTGVGIGAGALIESIDSATQITLTEASTVTDTTVALSGLGLTGAADGDFEFGLGSTAIPDAADGILAAGEENVGADVDIVAEAAAAGNDTTAEYLAAEASVYLNVSGTAATVDASGYVDVTGTVVIVGVMLGA